MYVGEHLLLLSNLNNRCDALAEAARSVCPAPNSYYHYLETKAVLLINDVEVTSHYQQAFRHAANSHTLRVFYKNKYKWKDSTIDSIDWQVHGRALKYLPPSKRKATLLMIHGWLPTNGHPSQAKKDLAAACPYCDHPTETNTHYLWCQHTKSLEHWSTASLNIETHLKKIYTDPILRKLLLSAVTEWRTHSRPPIPQHLPVEYHRLFKEQSAIGWDQILKGRLSTLWVSHQQAYLTKHHPKQNAVTWASSIVRTLWVHHHSIWKHRRTRHHGESTSLKNFQRQKQIHPRIKALYECYYQLDCQDQKILQRPMKELLEQPLSYKKKN